jgi:hypothetical protein
MFDRIKNCAILPSRPATKGRTKQGKKKMEKALKVIAALALSAGAVYVTGAVYLAFFYYSLKMFGL